MSKDKLINMYDKMNVVATEKNPYFGKGETYSIHPNRYENLVKKGWVLDVNVNYSETSKKRR